VTAPVFLVPAASLDALTAPQGPHGSGGRNGPAAPGGSGDAAGSRAPARLTLDGPEGRHAVSVRRLAPGEEVVLTDGAGRGAYGTVAAAEGKDVLHVDVREVRAEAPPAPSVTVVQALPKGDRGELAVETMTEAGVDAVVPWSAARCVTQWRGERGAKALAKWRATAREAAKQSRRLRFPDIAEPMSTRQVAQLLRGADFAAVLHEEGSAPLATAELPRAGSLVLVVGPEGGVSPE
jgi:16S rRNA (uracil1498-N3)-methyltransferase